MNLSSNTTVIVNPPPVSAHTLAFIMSRDCSIRHEDAYRALRRAEERGEIPQGAICEWVVIDNVGGLLRRTWTSAAQSAISGPCETTEDVENGEGPTTTVETKKSRDADGNLKIIVMVRYTRLAAKRTSNR